MAIRRHGTRWIPSASLAFSLTLGGILAPAPAGARVARVVVDRREVVLGGHVWGEHGVYEKLVGRIFFAFDPEDPANAAIVDLALAPRNGDGDVEAWADFMVLQPRDPSKRRDIAWLEVVNRGGKASLRYFDRAATSALDPTTAEDFGDGLLLRQGLTLIWVGWQWDVPDRDGLLRLHVPVARGPDGPIEGLVRSDWTVDVPQDTLDLAHRNHRPYLPSAPEDPRNVLTVRDGREGERTVVPRETWRFVATDGGHLDGVALDGGFEAGRIYELVYVTEDPRIVGLGLAAVRDVVSYAKYDLASEFPAGKAIAFGVSQTGRFLRHFLYQGFNVDEGGRKAFDGMLVHSAGAGRGSFNHRFAQPSRDGHPYSAFFYPTDLYPFTSRPVRDTVSGREEGLMDATRDRGRPLVFFTNTGYEYWGRAASLVHTSPDGFRDVMPLPTERLYHLASGQHFVGGFPPVEEDRMGPTGEEGGNPVAYRGDPLDFMPTLRALAVRLVEWVETGAEPPPSAYPTLADGTLVPPAAVAFPRLPGLGLPAVAHVAYRADYGSAFRSEGVVTRQPPVLGPPFPSQVSQVDGLGNEMAGVRAVELRVPVATYFPWNLRGPDAPAAPDALSDFLGTFVPLPRTEGERQSTGDPRPSLEILYGRRSDYMKRVVAAVQELVAEGFLLAEDAGRAAADASRRWDWRMEGGRGERAVGGGR